MEAENDRSPPWVFESNALGAYGNSSIRSDLKSGAKAPNIGPPGASRGRPQDRAFLLFSNVPGALGGEFEFAVGLLGIAMKSQSIDVRVGLLNI